MNQTVLPNTASELEKAIVQACSDIFQELFTVQYGNRRDIPIRTLWNPDLCQVDMLPYLACAMSVDTVAVKSFMNDETDVNKPKLRQLIKDSVSIHKKKGTIRAIRETIKSLGYALAAHTYTTTRFKADTNTLASKNWGFATVTTGDVETKYMVFKDLSTDDVVQLKALTENREIYVYAAGGHILNEIPIMTLTTADVFDATNNRIAIKDYDDSLLVDGTPYKLEADSTDAFGEGIAAGLKHWSYYKVRMRTPLSIPEATDLKKLIEATAPLSRTLSEFIVQNVHYYDGTIYNDGTYTHGVITT